VLSSGVFQRIESHMFALSPLPVIMLVIANPDVCQLFVECLRSELPYAVQSYTSISEALDTALDSPTRLVITDYQLADGDGITLAAQIQHRWPGTNVIMLTGPDDAPSAPAAHAAGVIAYLTRPVAPALLLRVVRAALP
jgi:two-component system, NarL family, sensor histidine kinase FusK